MVVFADLYAAANHKATADGLEMVMARAKLGGSSMEPPVPMLQRPNLKDDQVKPLTEWTLAGAPGMQVFSSF